MTVRLEFKPQDCWIGVFWRTKVVEKVIYPKIQVDLWVCVIPTLPIHLTWDYISV